MEQFLHIKCFYFYIERKGEQYQSLVAKTVFKTLPFFEKNRFGEGQSPFKRIPVRY
jgi:rubredoxin